MRDKLKRVIKCVKGSREVEKYQDQVEALSISCEKFITDLGEGQIARDKQKSWRRELKKGGVGCILREFAAEW